MTLKIIPLSLSLCLATWASAESFSAERFRQPNSSAPHAGKVDTDGILSPGELRNPDIDYDKAQRRGEYRGDTRVDNPYNDDAAADERSYQDREQDDAALEREWRERHDERRNQSRSWWNW